MVINDDGIYFGPLMKLPKGYNRFATLKDIKNINQIKRFGLYKVDGRLLKSLEKPVSKKDNEEASKIKLYENTIRTVSELHKKNELITGQQVVRYNKVYDYLLEKGIKPKYKRINFKSHGEKDLEPFLKKVTKKIIKKVPKKYDFSKLDEALKKNKISDKDLYNAEERLLDEFDFGLLKPKKTKLNKSPTKKQLEDFIEDFEYELDNYASNQDLPAFINTYEFPPNTPSKQQDPKLKDYYRLFNALPEKTQRKLQTLVEKYDDEDEDEDYEGNGLIGLYNHAKYPYPKN